MRDAFGGAFMIKLFLVFILVYIVFTALSLQYARAFQTKDKVISYLEENEVTDLEQYFNTGNNDHLNALNNILEEVKYNKTCSCGTSYCVINSKKEYGPETICYNGVTISKTGKDPKTKAVYYTVTTYVDWNIHWIKKLLTLDNNASSDGTAGMWKISGETRIVISDN